MSTPARQIASLTPLRGIAALLVVLYHIDRLLGFEKLGSLLTGSGFIARGYLWVDFFFVLSGFIITHVYGARFTGRIRREDVRAFVQARFARLYPLHFFALCLTVLLYIGVFSRVPAPADNGDGSGMAMLYNWKALPFHFLLLLGFGLTGLSWNVPAWSIAAEWWTYLLALPLFRYLNRGVSARTFLVPAACVLGLLALVATHRPPTLDIAFDFGLLRCFLDFTIGICLYQFYRARGAAAFLSTDRALVLAALPTVAILHFPTPGALPPTSSALFPDPGPFTPLFDALSPLVFAGLILCAALNTMTGQRLLNTKPLRRLGDISYSIYMMQGTAFLVFFIGGSIWRQKHATGRMDRGAMLGVTLATLLCDLLIALATYRWIEVPARAWLRGNRMRRRETQNEPTT